MPFNIVKHIIILFAHIHERYFEMLRSNYYVGITADGRQVQDMFVNVL